MHSLQPPVGLPALLEGRCEHLIPQQPLEQVLFPHPLTGGETGLAGLTPAPASVSISSGCLRLAAQTADISFSQSWGLEVRDPGAGRFISW